MSVQAMGWVLEHSRSQTGTRLVLMAIANHADADGRNAWPSQKRIAQEARVSVRTVRRAVDELVEMGELAVREYEGASRGRGRTHYYELSGYIATIEPRTDCPPFDSDTRTSATETRTNETPNPDTGGLQTVLEPSVEPSSSSSSAHGVYSVGLTSEEEEVMSELLELKLADRLSKRERFGPINNKRKWLRTTRADLLAGDFVEQHAQARYDLAGATPRQLARYLFDGSTPPRPPPEFACSFGCGEVLVGMQARVEHESGCDFEAEVSS